MATWVELRVHGVSGTPEREMLETDSFDTVQGDGTVASVRRTDRDGRFLPPEADGRVLEAFHWGRLTSGSRQRALWLLLVPFGLLNAAQFMVPCRSDLLPQAVRAVVGAALRVLGLLLTLVFVLAMVVGAVDLLAWQWLGREPGLPLGGGRPEPVVGATLLVAAVLVGLSRLGTHRRAAERAIENPFDRPGHRPTTPTTPPGFSSPDFFAGDPDAPVLRRLHVAGALALLACLLFAAADGAPADTWARVSAWLVVVAAGLVAGCGDAPGATRTALDVGQSAWARPARWLSIALLVAAGGLLAAAAGTVWLDGPTAAPSGRALPWVDAATTLLALAGLTALLVLAVSVAVLAVLTRHDQDDVPQRLRRLGGGCAGALVAAVGWFLGIGLTAGTTYLTQVVVDALTGARVEVPAFLQRVAYGWGVAVLLAVVAGAVVWARRGAAARRRRAVVAAMYTPDREPGAGPPAPRLSPAGVDRVARAVATARWKNALVPVVVGGCLLATVLSAAAVGEQLHGGACDRAACPPGDLPAPWGWASAVPADGAWASAVTGLGAVVLVGLAGAVAWLGHRGLDRGSAGAEARRKVNVVWDVVAFWPRTAHPFVPEAYSQVAVPALVDRIESLLSDGADAREVVVAGHSQGSLITLAAARSIRPDLYGRVGVVTFGSQLRMQFCRVFPAHVGPEVVGWLGDTWRTRWVSLFRETDPIAGPVRSWGRTPEAGSAALTSCRLWDEGPAPDDRDPGTLRRVCGGEWRLLDPPAGDPAGPDQPLRGHGGYWADPDWRRAVDVARGALTPAQSLTASVPRDGGSPAGS